MQNKSWSRSEIVSNEEEIIDAVFLYHTANADLTQAQTEAKIRDRNYDFLQLPVS